VHRLGEHWWIKLVHLLSYTKIHGQRNIKISTKRLSPLTQWHGVTSQKTRFLSNIAVRTSKLNKCTEFHKTVYADNLNLKHSAKYNTIYLIISKFVRQTVTTLNTAASHSQQKFQIMRPDFTFRPQAIPEKVSHYCTISIQLRIKVYTTQQVSDFTSRIFIKLVFPNNLKPCLRNYCSVVRSASVTCFVHYIN
jgi:hypothetical protein